MLRLTRRELEAGISTAPVLDPTWKVTPLSLAIFKFFDSLLIFFPIVLYAIRRTSPQTFGKNVTSIGAR